MPMYVNKPDKFPAEQWRGPQDTDKIVALVGEERISYRDDKSLFVLIASGPWEIRAGNHVSVRFFPGKEDTKVVCVSSHADGWDLVPDDAEGTG